MTNNRPSGFANPWFQLGLNIVCVVLYELLLKAGAKATADLSQTWGGTGITGLASPLIWLAVVVIISRLVILGFVFEKFTLFDKDLQGKPIRRGNNFKKWTQTIKSSRK